MVKKRMAMRMVTIFVALIVCGMFFPALARGLSVPRLEEPVGEVVVGESRVTSVGITNDGDHEFKIWLALNTEATCAGNFTYTGPAMYPDSNPESRFGPGDTLTVTVTYTPSDVGEECEAWLQITPLTGEPGVEIHFIAEGIEKPPEPSGEIVIGTIKTGVLDREDEDGVNISDLIKECQEMARNCGHAERCISRLTTHLTWKGIISFEEKKAIKKASLKAAMRNMIQEIETARSSVIGNDNSKHWWRKWHRNWRDR